jgi:hypothetical protein
MEFDSGMAESLSLLLSNFQNATKRGGSCRTVHGSEGMAAKRGQVVLDRIDGCG